VRLPGHTAQTGPRLIAAGRAKPLSEVIGPLKLDRITVVDDSDWLDMIDCEANLPACVAPGLRERSPPGPPLLVIRVSASNDCDCSFRSRSISCGPGPAIYCSIAKVLPSGSLNQATLPSPSSWIPLVSAFSVGSA
jgi:hypothetical protein